MSTPIRSLICLVPMFIGLAVCYAVGEFYPFSSFPMYSKFDDRTYLVYLKSVDGMELPNVKTVNMFASQMKKRYGDELKELKKDLKGSHFDWSAEQKRPAGEALLRYLRDTYAPNAFAGGKLDGLRLIDVRVFRDKDGKITTREEEVATLPAD